MNHLAASAKRVAEKVLMGHRAKRPVVAKRCPICGVQRYDFEGERSKCPYTALHAKAAAGAEAQADRENNDA